MTKAAELAKMGEVLTNSKIGGRRNLIINGSCKINQRGDNGSSKTSGGDFATDRFKTSLNGIGTWTIENVTDSPSEFTNSHKLTCTSADTSISAADFALCRYIVEGQDLQQLAFGTSDAKPFTFSFYVKSNKTGNATVEINQQDADPIRRVSLQYTINQANTWERKILTVTGDTSGTINNDTGGALEIYWWLRSGSTYTGGSHATTFAAINSDQRNASNLDVGASDNDTFQVTGVQLEVGSQATPFEHRSFGEEERLCHRYYFRVSDKGGGFGGVGSGPYNDTTSNVFIGAVLPTRMRADPDIGYSALSDFDVEPFDLQPSAITTHANGGGANSNICRLSATVSSGTKGHSGELVIDTDNGFIEFDSEY